jgi:hypothetical protein
VSHLINKCKQIQMIVQILWHAYCSLIADVL